MTTATTVRPLPDGYWTDPYGVTAAMREEAPVWHVQLPNGVRVHLVTRFDDAKAVLGDRRLRKDATRLVEIIGSHLAEVGHDPSAVTAMIGPTILFSDGPDHTRLRGLLASTFTSARMNAMRDRVEALASALLDDLDQDCDEGPVDLVARLAFPLPMAVVCELLGVPEGDDAQLRAWTGILMDEIPDEVAAVQPALAAYVADLIEAKRSAPGEDLLSALLSAEADGSRMSPLELVSTVILMLVGAHETATNLISNSAAALLTDPARWQALAQNPGSVGDVVAEMGRWRGSLRNSTHRYTTEQIVIGGTTIEAGEIVLASMISANTDPRVYDDPDEYRPGRSGPRHLSFGHGAHYCLGWALGQTETEIALRQLTTRYPNARLAVPSDQLELSTSPIMIGHQALPVWLRP